MWWQWRCLVPLGSCVASVLLGEVFKTEFLVLQCCTHEVILEIDFLQDCEASVNCSTGEITVNSMLLSALADMPSLNKDNFISDYGVCCHHSPCHMSLFLLLLPTFHHLTQPLTTCDKLREVGHTCAAFCHDSEEWCLVFVGI